MTKRTMKSIQNAHTTRLIIRRLKAAVVWTLMLAMVWNSTVIPVAEAASRARGNSSKPLPKKSSKPAKPAVALQGQTVVVWGPQQVVRQAVNTTYNASFNLPSGALPPYQMTVSNGAPDGTRKVSQACVQLNGVNVLSPTCYHNLNPTPQVRTVTLQANNNISVSLIGTTLSYITITITGTPASLAASPTSGTQGQTLSVTLTGTGTNWVNGQTMATFGGEITVNSVTVGSATSATANITISSTAALGPRTITTTTGSEIVSGIDAFTVNAVTPPGSSASTVSTLAGSAGNAGFADGTGATARFRSLAGIAAAPPSTLNDTVYVADAGNHAIRKVDSSGAVTTIAGSGSPGFSDGQGTFGTFSNPQGVAVDSAGNVYVADTGNHSIRKVDVAGNVTTIAGDGTAGFTNGIGAAARFNSPKGVAVDNTGRVYVADTGNHAVRRIETNGSVVTIAGDGTIGSSNGTGASSRFNGLAGITVDGQTVYVYIADTGNHQIRRLDASPAVILLAGQDRGFRDGTAAQSRFADPVGIATDGAGHVVIAETTNSLLREVDPALALNSQPNAVYTLAGTGGRGSTDGAGNVAQFNKPSGVAVLTSSAVIVADTGNNTLRKVLLPPVIAALSPTQGNVGAAVTITGDRFDERGASFNTVKFTASGGTINATVTSATRSQITVTVPTGAITGNVTLQTAGGTSNGVTFTVGTTQPPAIADFNPKTGPVGTLVTITGTNLMVGATTPSVTFAGANNTRLPAQIAFASTTEVRATVPNATITGVIQLTTSLGTATSAVPFTIAPSQDYTLTLAPSSQTVVQGSTANYVVSATSPQTTFTQLISLTATGLPSGAVATFNPAQITAGATSTMSLKLSPSISPTSYSFTVQGVTKVDGSDLTRTTGGSLTVMASGSTTLAGRVLSTDGVPIPGASVSAPAPGNSTASTTTDGAGNFLLIGLQAGLARPILIQPAQTNIYPIIKEPADVVANQSNTVPYTFYLPAIDHADEKPITLDNQGVVQTAVNITNQRVPGLTMTIPKDIRLIGLNGQPLATGTYVSITPVPIDRTPAPLPSNISTTLVYTSQPGSLCSAKLVNGVYSCDPNGMKIPVTYPNLSGADPGTRVPLWAFDHDLVQWYQYGMGTVSSDGRLILPDSGVGLKDFSWHFAAVDPKNANFIDCFNKYFLPVNLATGAKLETATDIAFGGAQGGLVLSRVYSNDQAIQGGIYAFGQWTHNYDIRLSGAVFSATGETGRLRLPNQLNGSLFSFTRVDASTGARVFTTTGTPGQVGDELMRLTDGTLDYRTAQGDKMHFDSSGRLSSIVSANSNTVTLSYTGNNLTQITDPVGRVISLSYDSNGRVQTATDPLGRITRYAYDGSGRLISVTDPLGNVIRYGFDIAGRLTSITDPRNNLAKAITYYGVNDGINNGRVRSETLADGGTITFSYSYSGQSVTGVTIVDQLGRSQTKRFNAAGLTIGMTDAVGLSTQIDRDLSTGWVRSSNGSCGCAELTMQYNARGFSTSATDRLGQTWQMSYDSNFNHVQQATDELGHITTISYDTHGNPTSITNALGQTTNFAYDTFGQLTRITDALGHVQQAEYDVRGNVTATIDALGNRTTMQYDVVGRLTSVSDPLNRQISITYDDDNRVLTVTDSAGAVTTFTYDANGNRTKVRDHLGREWTATYDVMNRPVMMTDPLGKTVRLEYDQAGELTKATSPSGSVVRYEYDVRGLMVKMIDSLSGEVRYTYDAQGSLVSLRDQRGNITTYTYDLLHRPISARDPLGRQTTVQYDAADNITAITDRLGRRTSIAYDSLNRPSTVTHPDATVMYNYDAAGRPIQVTDTQGGSIVWSYDNADRLLSETSPAGTVSYAYNAASQLASLTAADRPSVTYSYDTAGRLSTITQGTEAFSYTYDAISRRTRLQRPNGVRTDYQYDLIDRLTRLTHTDSAGGVLEDFQYAYNTDNEITKITSLYSAPLVSQSKIVGAADSANRIAQVGAASFSFDQEGQPTTKTDAIGTTNYTWDARGRLTKAVLPGGQTANYGYDALGRRTSRTENGVTTNYLHAGSEVVLDRAGGSSTVEYLNGAGIDERLRQTNIGASNYYFLQDHLGSTSALTNSAGSIIERQQYDSFGANAAASLTRYGYTGRDLDSLTGLMYYRARWYDPQQGRFISEDPIGYAGGLNLYGYVGNSPLSFTDPSGRAWFVPFLVAGGVNVLIEFAISQYRGECYGWRNLLADFTLGVFAEAGGIALGAFIQEFAWGRRFMEGLDGVFGTFGQGLKQLGQRMGQRFGPRFGRGLEEIGNGLESTVGRGGGSDVPEFTFRGDSRPPGEIFENGFQPRGSNTDLEKYVFQNSPSDFVGTSRSPNVAREFFGEPGDWVYTVRPGGQGIDVNQVLGPHMYDYELEIAIRGGISPGNILGARQIGPNGFFTGPFVRNPLSGR